MTEAEWLASQNLVGMVDFVEGESARKRRLFAVAACRQLGPLPPECDVVLSATELYADDAMNKRQMLQTHEAMWAEHPHEFNGVADLCSRTSLSWHGRRGQLSDLLRTLATNPAIEPGHLTAMLRCVFGNPFRPVSFTPAWRATTVLAIAEGVYAERAFDRLPVLADALEDAGCDSEELLAHLRGPGPHARGCWAVDAVLGKN